MKNPSNTLSFLSPSIIPKEPLGIEVLATNETIYARMFANLNIPQSDIKTITPHIPRQKKIKTAKEEVTTTSAMVRINKTKKSSRSRPDISPR